MATARNDPAPWQRTGSSAAAAGTPGEPPVWTGLLPAVLPAGSGPHPVPVHGDLFDDGVDPLPGAGAAPPAGGSTAADGSRAHGAASGGADAPPGGPAVGVADGAHEDPADGTDDDAAAAQARRRAALRRDALADEPRLPRLQQVFLALLLPLALLAAAVRAVATPVFLWIEYHRPGFPADPYGFTAEDRMVYGSYGLDYVLNWAPPAFLGGLGDGRGQRLFLDAEVQHMTDVQLVLQAALAAVAVLVVVGVVSALYLRARAPGAASGALFFGSWLTVLLLVVLAVAAVLGWQQFFTIFHSLFFAEGSWNFRATDTLIRLYPTRFWMDAALTVGALALLGALAVMAATWPTRFRRQRARDRVRRRQELGRRLAGR